MKKERKQSKITDLMTLVVFALFEVCVLAVLLTGAEVYRKLVDRGAADYDRRTAVQYVATRVRQADQSGAVTVEEFGGESALVLRETQGGESYLTRIYCCDGFLRELFTGETGEFSPADGEKLLEAEEISFDLAGNVLSVQITFPDGAVRELTLYLRSGEGAEP